MDVLTNCYAMLQQAVYLALRPFLEGRVRRPNKPTDWLTWANGVSLTRAVLAALICLTPLNTAGSLLAVTAAAISDLTDGVLAQRFFGRTRSGAIIDPACDKIFVIGFAWAHRLEFELRPLLAVAAIELLLFAGQMALLIQARLRSKRFRKQALESNIFGKAKGFFECGAFLACLLGLPQDGSSSLLWAAVICAILSAYAQIRGNPDPYET